MYKKIKYTKEEKRVIPTIIVIILIQVLIIYGFLSSWEDRHPLDIKDTEQITITVEKVYEDEGFGKHVSDRLIVASKTDEFAFDGDEANEGYPLWKLEKLISKGDTLTLTFIRNERWGGGIHTVVAAKTETETYRTLEGYNRGSKLTPYLIIFAFFTLESLFLGAAYFLYFLTLPSVLRDIKKKRLKNAKRKKKYKEKQEAEKLEAKNI